MRQSLEEYIKNNPPPPFEPGFCFNEVSGEILYFFRDCESSARYRTKDLSTYHSMKDDSLVGIGIIIDDLGEHFEVKRKNCIKRDPKEVERHSKIMETIGLKKRIAL